MRGGRGYDRLLGGQAPPAVLPPPEHPCRTLRTTGLRLTIVANPVFIVRIRIQLSLVGSGSGYHWSDPDPAMVLILDDNSEIGAHIKSNLCYLICLRH